MLATIIIVFRETIEAGLIIGIILAATRGVAKRHLWVAYGVLIGLAGAGLLAQAASLISNAFSGTGQEILNAGILLTAVIMLACHNIWMAKHGREMARDMKAVGKEVATGRRSLIAITTVIAAAVLREGAEVVLFLYGIAAAGQETAAAMLVGGAGGIALGAGTSFLMYKGLLRIPDRHLFRVTGWLITLLAAGMAAQAAAFLQQAQIINVMEKTAWDTSAFISSGSLTGKVLHTLVGYTDHPTVLQLAAYIITLTAIVTLARLFSGHEKTHNPSQAF